MSVQNQLPHVPIEESQQDCPDMSAILVGIGKNNNLVITERRNVEVFSDPGTQSGNNGAKLIVLQNLVKTFLLYIERLSAKRKNCLKATIPALFCGAAGAVTLNEAKTEATMEMPASDVTLEYELVRDLTVAVDLNLLIDQQPVTRARIARVGNGPYQLQGNWQFAAIDKLDAQNPVSLTNGELVYTLKKKDGDGYVAVNTETDLAPGLWRLEATANEGKPYDGTIYSADIELYAVYDLYLSPAQDENVSVTANDKAVSPDAEGKISEVESGKTVKLNVTNADYIIRKATVKGATVSYKVESQFTNGNNYGASTDLKTVLESTDLPVTIKLSDAISFPWNDESAKITSIELQSWGSDPAILSEYSMDGRYVVNPGDVTITFNSLIGATSDTSVLTVNIDYDGLPQTNRYDIKLSLNQ